MEQLGLGVRLSLDDDMSSHINPLIRDLERLRRTAQRTSGTFNDMSRDYNPFSRSRRGEVEDYYASMQSMDRVLLNVSERMIRASNSANRLGQATNRMQFTGNFNQMYNDVMRVQRVLGNMGFGMSQMQKDMSNVKAFNMIDKQFKDLQDKIKLTSKAMKEMQASPDSAKFVKEIDLAKRSLLTYQMELKRVGSLQKKLAETHGYGLTKSGGKDVLYEKNQSTAGSLKAMAMASVMKDMAKASNIAYSSLDRTEKMMVGVGYTAMEAKQKAMQLVGQLQMVGMALTQFLTVPSALAIAGLTAFASKFETAYNTFSARTLTATNDMSKYRNAMGQVWKQNGDNKWEDVGVTFAGIKNTFGDIPIDKMNQMATAGLDFKNAWDVDSMDAINTAMGIQKTFATDSATSYDLLALAMSKTNGNLEDSQSWLKQNASNLDLNSSATRNYYETMQEGINHGGFQALKRAMKSIGDLFRTIWDNGMSDFITKIANMITSVNNLATAFMQAHPTIAKLVGIFGAVALAVGLLAGPVILVTAFLLRFKNVIAGVGHAVAGMSKGGLAVLHPQAKMASDSLKAMTVAVARFPQTVIKGFLPALYNIVRGLPQVIMNIAKMNPAMSALTVGMVAYANNWYGIADIIDDVAGKIGKSWETAMKFLDTGGKGMNFDQFDGLTKVFSKVIGSARIAKKVLESIFQGDTLKFTTGEANLMESMGITDFINGIAKAGRIAKDFYMGFVDGVSLALNAVKTFVGWLAETFEPLIVSIGNAISKLFGGEGDSKTIEDIASSANNALGSVQNLGKMAGVAVTALLGFKLIKPLLSGMFKGLVKNPFSGIISSANRARRAISGMGRAVRGGVSNLTGNRSTTYTNSGGAITSRTRGGMSSHANPNDRNPRGNSTIHSQPTMSPLTRSGSRPMTPTQERLQRQLVANQNARSRGYDVSSQTALSRRDTQRLQQGALRGNSRISRNGRVNLQGSAVDGQQIHRRRQGVVSRALFGQAYDAYDQQGRRHNVNRQGGILRRASQDGAVNPRMSTRDRVGTAVGGATRAMTQQVRVRYQGLKTKLSPIAQTVKTKYQNAKNAVVNSRAMKPITVPVRYAMGRLRTAGIIRQGNQAGRQSGSRFRRAFQSASRGIRVSMTSVVRTAGRTGRTAGRLMGRGISLGVKVGLRAIPILGWALMAWDIIVTIFTNWDAIVNAAKTAWNWIKTDGVNALKSAWEAIKSGAKIVWEMVKNLAKSAWDAIKDWAINSWNSIKDTATNVAQSIGEAIYNFISEKVTAVKEWFVSTFMAIPGAVASVGTSIGTSIWNGITGALSGIGSWISDKVGSAVSSVTGVFGGKKHARGGLINAPHVGLVGEAGPEMIIPLSGNQRDRAKGLLSHTAGILGMNVEQTSPEENSVSNYAQDMGGSSKGGSSSSKVVRQQTPVVRNQKPVASSQGSSSVDNSINISSLQLNVQDGKNVSEHGAKIHAKTIAKELQKLMKQERLKGKGNKLTLEEMILNV